MQTIKQRRVLKLHRGTHKWVILLLLALVAMAREVRADTFKLNTPMPEESVYCFSEKSANDIADAGSPDAGASIILAYFRTGECVIMKAVIVYSRKVHQHGNIRVYEGKVGAITVFNPTDWVAEGEKDL